MTSESVILEWPGGISEMRSGQRAAFEPPKIWRAPLSRRERLELRHTPNISVAPIIPTQLSSTQDAGTPHEDSPPRAATGAGVTVALLDSGVDGAHEAFDGLATLEQRDFVGDGLEDVVGHGTSCASVMFGARGLAPGVTRALSARVIGAQSQGDSHAMYEGLVWACEQGAQVICMALNLGFGALLRSARALFDTEELAHAWALDAYTANVEMLAAVTTWARASGAILLASSGNDARRRTGHTPPPTVPASLSKVLAVGGVRQNPEGLWRGLRHTNVPADLGAWGDGVVGAVAGTRDGWRAKTGSSVAAAYAAGVAAQWREVAGEDAWETMLAHADTSCFVDDTEAQLFGFGVISAPRDTTQIV